MRLTKKLPWHMLPAIFTLAWPTMLEQLMQTAVQYVDTAMVGTLGTQATAAVGATGTVSVNSCVKLAESLFHHRKIILRKRGICNIDVKAVAAVGCGKGIEHNAKRMYVL